MLFYPKKTQQCREIRGRTQGISRILLVLAWTVVCLAPCSSKLVSLETEEAHGIQTEVHGIQPEIWVGFTGTSSRDRDVQILRNALRQNKVQGLILFSRNIQNPKQLRNLISFLTQDNKKIVVALDQEGGKIMRLKKEQGFHQAGSMAAAENYKDIQSITRIHEAAAEEMRNLGITMVFGPVADVNKNPKCPVIGLLGRSFSQDPKKVIERCNAVLAAYEKYGIRGCLKHAPGHGSSTVDSHRGVVDITKTWSQEELEPFIQCFKAHPKTAFMVGHLMHRDFDPDLPCSMSKKTLVAMNRALVEVEWEEKSLEKNLESSHAQERIASQTLCHGKKTAPKNAPFYVADAYEMRAVSSTYSPREFLHQCTLAGMHAVLFFCELGDYPKNYRLEDFLKEGLGIDVSLD